MSDLLHKILLAIESSSSPSLPGSEIFLFQKELEKFVDADILIQCRSTHADCKECSAPCEIKTLSSGVPVICCEECQSGIVRVNENELQEYRISIRALLSSLLIDLGYESKEIIENLQGKLWSMGTHNFNESPRLFLFVTSEKNIDENAISYLKQNQHLNPILLSPLTPSSPQAHSFVPLDAILATKGRVFFNAKLFRSIVGESGTVASTECIYLGEDRAICIEKKRVLFGLNSLETYEKSENISGITFDMIAFLVKASEINRNTWKSRKNLSESFHCKEDTISNKMSLLRGISEKIGIDIIEQHTASKKFRINPNLVVRSSSLTSSLKNRF